MKNLLLPISLTVLYSCSQPVEKIDREQVVKRNNPVVNEFEELSSLSVGNGEFAFTVDASGLQTFPYLYQTGVPLGTQSQWGWHSFPNDENFKFEECLRVYTLHGRDELYASQYNEKSIVNDPQYKRNRAAANYFRVNPHRLHLGVLGLDMDSLKVEDFSDINQTLDLWNGEIISRYSLRGEKVSLKTACHPQQDQIAFSLNSALLSKGDLRVKLTLPYPTGKHSDYACDFENAEKHSSKIIDQNSGGVLIEHRLDTTVYYISLNWSGNASLKETSAHNFVLSSAADSIDVTCRFLSEKPLQENTPAAQTFLASESYWNKFWKEGGCADFSKCTDERAKELERRVVLSQYLLAIQSAGSVPPQETGLTYNSWFGKFHLEMHWWHAANFALWNRTELLERSLDWYAKAYPVAKKIAERQGYKGARWMKMTDPSAAEAPSKVGSFLIWQQPHFIYMAELVYRNKPSQEVLDKYKFLVEETAAFMASFATYDELEGRYILQGEIPAQETLRADRTINPPFELSYWHYAMQVAQTWRERCGEARRPQWDELIDKLSPLASQDDGLYLAAETQPDTYTDIRYHSDHMAMLGALGVLPECKLVRKDYMQKTFDWVYENWNWGKTWGWDYPMTAMCAVRLGQPQKAVDAIMMKNRTNTYLVNGHNYQDSRLRVYLPGNGGLLNTVALMCAGWDGCQQKNPGFPKDGSWNVVWEDIKPLP